MSNGAVPTVPGSDQPVTLRQPETTTEAPYLPEQPAPTSESDVPEPVQKELTELRALREQVSPLMPLVEQLGGESLYQHYAQYANMLQERQNQPAPQQPAQPQPAAESDPWGEPQVDPYVQQLEAKIQALEGQVSNVTRSVGVDKVAAHSQRFFDQEFPDLTDAEKKTINDGMGRTFKGYADSEQGRSFLQNPQYEAVRALAINQMPPGMLEEVYRRKFERERTNRSRLSTDSYRTTAPGTEEVDMGDDFLSAWEGSAEKVRREGGI
jgi:hypothetical protein